MMRSERDTENNLGCRAGVFLHFSEICPSLCLAGSCGNWNNYFTVVQSEAFDKVYWKKMSTMDPSLFFWSLQ
jgi:hypothetical protein